MKVKLTKIKRNNYTYGLTFEQAQTIYDKLKFLYPNDQINIIGSKKDIEKIKKTDVPKVNDKPMSVGLVTQLIYDSAMSLENCVNTKEQTVEELLNIIDMIDERGIKL